MREELQVSHNSRVTIRSSPLYEAAYAKLQSHERLQSRIPLTPLPPTHPRQASDEPSVAQPYRAIASSPSGQGSSSSFITLPIASSSAVDSELDDPFDDPLVVDDSETEDNGTPEAEAIKTYPVVLIVWTTVGLFYYSFISTNIRFLKTCFPE